MSKRRKINTPAAGSEVHSNRLSVAAKPFAWQLAAAFAALIAALLVYEPSVAGPFLFDDIGLPFYQPWFQHESFTAWLSGVRPLGMLTYWVNFQLSGRDPWTYHLLNIVLHVANSCLVFLLFSQILKLSAVERRRAQFCAAAGAAIFLLHPLQTESVAYIAGRSEVLCGLFTLAAMVVFCGRESEKISWKRAAAVIALYGCAVLSKEQAAVLPALLFALDMLLRKQTAVETLRKGLWLYAPLAVAGGLAVAGVAFVLASSATAGFNVPGVHWYEYLFTQFRVWLLYLGLAVLPVRQNADYDLALSHTLGDHGAGLAAVGLFVAAVAVIRTRKRFPILFCGCVMFAALLAPTSSIVPLQDLAAERRMYLPLAGLLLMGLQFLARVRMTAVNTAAVVTAILVCCVLTRQRAAVWASDVALWTDVTRAAPLKVRGHTQLAYAWMRAGGCRNAVKAALDAPARVRQDALFMAILGQAYACDQRMPEATDAMEQAVLIEPSVGRMLVLAAIYRQASREADAEATEQQAFRFPPRSAYDHNMLSAARNFRSRSAVKN